MAISVAWSWMSLRSLALLRETRNKRAQVGQAIEERLTLVNRSLLPKLWIEVNDQSTLPDHRASRVVGLGSRGAKFWQTRTKCKQRGKYTLGPVTLQSGDPFGFFRFRRVLREKHTILVYPETIPLPELNIHVGILPGGGTMRHRVQYITPNVAGVRDYVSGDSFNRIHWASTARMNKLMVKEFELDPFSEMWLLLDMQGRHHRGKGEHSTVEYAVKAAASLSQRFLEQNRSVGLTAHGPQRQLIVPDRGTRQIWKLLEELAITQGVGSVPLHEMLTAEATRFGRHTTLVIVTPSPDLTWVYTLREVLQAGVKAVAVIIDAESFGGSESSSAIVGELLNDNIPTYIVKKGDALDRVLVGDGCGQIKAPITAR
jgi:uncharacterized protein (DUF58 family)